MAIFGSGGGNGEELEARKKIIESIRSETDMIRLAKYITLDQTDHCYDPCGKSWTELNTVLTDMSRSAVRRMHELMTGELPT